MKAYHLALFGEGNCPGELPVENEPGVGDKRKWAEANKPVCLALGGDTFLYTSKEQPKPRTDKLCLSFVRTRALFRQRPKRGS